LVKKAIHEHAKYTTAELDRSRPVKKEAATRRRLSEQVAVDMHTMGASFVAKVRDVRQIAEAQIGEGVADMVEFEAQVNGHEATEKANRIQAWQSLLDWQLADRFDRDRPVLHSSTNSAVKVIASLTLSIITIVSLFCLSSNLPA